MSLTGLVLTVCAITLLLCTIHLYQVKTVPREQYIQAIFEYQSFQKEEWVNEMLIRSAVSKLLKKEISAGHNAFNLRQLIQEELLEYKKGTTGISGEIVIPVATFRVTDKGLCKYKGSPP